MTIGEAQEKVVGFYLIKFSNGLFFGHGKDVIRAISKFKEPWNREVLDVYYIATPEAKALVDHIKATYIAGNFILDGNLTEVIKTSLVWCKGHRTTRHARLRKFNINTNEVSDPHVKNGEIVSNPVLTKAAMIDEVLRRMG